MTDSDPGPSKASTNPSDNTSTLEQTFKHPAGLRLARYLVVALLEKARSQTDSTQVSRPLFGSNPAVMDDIREILLFKEQRPTPNQHTSGINTLSNRSEEANTTSSSTSNLLNHFQISNIDSSSSASLHTSIQAGSSTSSLPPANFSYSSAKMDKSSAYSQTEPTNPNNKSPPLPSALLSQDDSLLSRPPSSSKYPSNPPLMHSPALALNRQQTIKSFLPVNKVGENTHSGSKTSLFGGLFSAQLNALTSLDSHIGGKPSTALPFAEYTSEKLTNSLVQSQVNSLLSNHRSEQRSSNSLSLSSSSETLDSVSNPTNTDTISASTEERQKLGDTVSSKKRKSEATGESRTKKMRKSNVKGKSKDPAISNEETNEGEDKQGNEVATQVIPAREQLCDAIWMRILEFTPPQFLKKARLVNQKLKGLVDNFDSIFINCRKENFGWDMPPPPPGLTERQYSDLLGGKGCQAPGCGDKKATKTHWSWAKRWCAACWAKNLEREDRIFKSRQNQYGRTTVTKLLECIPVAISDSFQKPHKYTQDLEPPSRAAPRLYKVYLSSDIQRIIEKYEALTPPPYKEDPTHTPAQKQAALDAHKALMDALDGKRAEFFAAAKAKNDEHMAKVEKIEEAVRLKRLENSKPYAAARKGRAELFTRRANEDLPHIPTDFVKGTKAFKAATRVSRDGGTERGWKLLRPKIAQEWDDLIHGASSSGPVSGNTAVPSNGNNITNNVDNEENADLDSNSPDDEMDVDNDYRTFQSNSTAHYTGSFGNSSGPSAFTASLPAMSLPQPVTHYQPPFPHYQQASPTSNANGYPLSSPAAPGSSSTHISVHSLLRPQSPGGSQHYDLFA